MTQKASKVLVVLADTQGMHNQSVLRRCASEFCTLALKENLDVDFLDLHRDGYQYRTPLMLDRDRKTDQVIDYQMKLKSADWVVFFYQTVLGTMPGHLKSFLDAVIVNGVAYSSQDTRETYLDDKKASVYVFEPLSQLEAQLYNANREDFFWKRVVFRTSGLQGEIKQFFNTSKLDGNRIDKMIDSVQQLLQGFVSRNTSLAIRQ